MERVGMYKRSMITSMCAEYLKSWMTNKSLPESVSSQNGRMYCLWCVVSYTSRCVVEGECHAAAWWSERDLTPRERG